MNNLYILSSLISISFMIVIKKKKKSTDDSLFIKQIRENLKFARTLILNPQFLNYLPLGN